MAGLSRLDAGDGRIILVVGNSRSGTTMMGRILGNHESVFTFQELHFFEQMWSRKEKESHLSREECINLFARLLCTQREGYFAQCDRKRAFYLAEAGLKIEGAADAATPTDVLIRFMAYETARHGKSIPCEQTPRNVYYIREILEIFPGARVINMVRDPRDVLLSQKRRWKRPFLSGGEIPRSQAFRYWINYHPITISKLWNSAVAAGDALSGDTRVYTLRFEDLVSRPDFYMRQVCDFVGIAYDPEMLDVPRIGSSSSHDDPAVTGIDREKKENWRRGGLNSAELYISQRMTATYMSKHGYELIERGANPLSVLFYLFVFPFKISIALLLNLKRMKNIKETLMKRLR